MLPVLAEHLAAAREQLPAPVFDYYSAGSGDEVTAAEAEGAWLSYRLRPRVLRDVSSVDLTTTLLGSRAENPFLVAPMAFHALADEDGECATVAGAGQAGSLFVLSTRSSVRIEQVAAQATAP